MNFNSEIYKTNKQKNNNFKIQVILNTNKYITTCAISLRAAAGAVIGFLFL